MNLGQGDIRIAQQHKVNMEGGGLPRLITTTTNAEDEISVFQNSSFNSYWASKTFNCYRLLYQISSSVDKKKRLKCFDLSSYKYH